MFHSAATVKFDERLDLSVKINILGTKRLLQLCHRMMSLDVSYPFEIESLDNRISYINKSSSPARHLSMFPLPTATAIAPKSKRSSILHHMIHPI